MIELKSESNQSEIEYFWREFNEELARVCKIYGIKIPTKSIKVSFFNRKSFLKKTSLNYSHISDESIKKWIFEVKYNSVNTERDVTWVTSNLGIRIDEIYAKSSVLPCEKVFQLFENKIELGYESYCEYDNKKHRINYITLYIQSLQTYFSNHLKDLQNFKIFEKCFINSVELGSGGYGKVFKVEDKWKQHYAVKKIELKG